MRFKVIAKQYKGDGNLIVRLSDGRIIIQSQTVLGRHLDVGSTGTVMQGQRGLRFILDAIDHE